MMIDFEQGYHIEAKKDIPMQILSGQSELKTEVTLLNLRTAPCRFRLKTVSPLSLCHPSKEELAFLPPLYRSSTLQFSGHCGCKWLS